MRCRRTPIRSVLKHLARATGLHPSTAHRILNDLVVGRYVDRAETPGSYRLGMRLLELGNLVKARLSVREAALEPMRELHKRTGQTVNLSVRQGDEIVYVDRSYSERSGMQVVRAIGGRAPLHLTSSGKLFLALDDPRLIRAYATRTGLAGHTRNSLTDVGKLERELSMVRTRGYARDNEELEVGVRCIAAGIRDDSGRLVAGLSVSAPAERMQDDWIAELLQTAGRISAGLGFVNAPSEAAALRQNVACVARYIVRRDDIRCSSRSRCFRQPGRLEKISDAFGVAEPRIFSDRIEQHHHDALAFDHRLHHQATARRGNVAGLLQADLPLGVVGETISVAIVDGALADCQCKLAAD